MKKVVATFIIAVALAFTACEKNQDVILTYTNPCASTFIGKYDSITQLLTDKKIDSTQHKALHIIYYDEYINCLRNQTPIQ